MRRPITSSCLILGAGLLAAACSSSPATHGIDIALCARFSACLGNWPLPIAENGLRLPFGGLCEALTLGQATAARGGFSGLAFTQPQLDCIAAASSCSAVEACFTANPAEIAACVGKSQPECQGQVVVDCGSTHGVDTEDCAASGLVCGQNANGVACGVAACDPTKVTPSCDGDTLVGCSARGGLLQKISCAAWQSNSCVANNATTCHVLVANTCAVVGGTAQCIGNGAVCDDATFGSRCDGTVMSTCTGGHVATFDCASYGLGLTCLPDDTSGASCAPISRACNDGSPETCDDGVIGFCLFGIKVSIDCKSFGLSGCTVSSPETAVANCTP